jgi:serine/threonine-protein kinase
MTVSAPLCAGCGRPLAPDDRFCSKCGHPTSVFHDPESTLVVGGEPDQPDAAASSEITAPRDFPEGAVPTSPALFNQRLRDILDAEYEVYSLIGQGGFARVYKARDRRLDRVVAIKVIRPEVVGTKLFVDSFRNEGVALAKLRHPAIVPIYDIRERGGLIYYIMPFVQGTTLDARLERGRLPPYESRRILCELTDALHAAHKAGMVHLDIKPANVFLEGDLGKVLLMDFGTARALHAAGDDAGPVVGTPEYMSPEQARGLATIDHRSDIYSLGALGFRMLLGRPPFSGRDATAILEQLVSEEPPSIRYINPTIPKDFADAIQRCLAKAPGERFSTAKELEAALQAVTFRTTQEQSAMRATGSHAKPADPARARIVLLVVLALVAGVLAGILIA